MQCFRNTSIIFSQEDSFQLIAVEVVLLKRTTMTTQIGRLARLTRFPEESLED